MEKTYVCKKNFSVNIADDDGFTTDDYMAIEANTRWEVDNTPFRVVGDNDSIRLLGEDGRWIELTKESLDEYFSLED